MEYLDSCGQKVEAFVRASDQFQQSCSAAFETVDVRGVGKVSVQQAATAVHFFFKDVGRAVDDFGIRIKEPTGEEIKQILTSNGYKEGDSLNRHEFEDLYVAVLKYAAVKCAEGFAQKYGVGMAVGFAALVIFKKAVRSLPVVGGVAKPLLGLFPAPIVGPLLGIIGVYIADRGDLNDVRRKLFSRGSRGQFKSG